MGQLLRPNPLRFLVIPRMPNSASNLTPPWDVGLRGFKSSSGHSWVRTCIYKARRI